MYRKVDDFLAAYPPFVESTKKLFAAMRDEDLGRKVAEDHRTLGGMAWHIVMTVPEMMAQVGLEFPEFDADALPPDSAASIVTAYDKWANHLLEIVKTTWTDETLTEVDEMYGMQWPRGLTLAVLLRHEIHHRGQMTVLMRQAGLRVPGLFGPAKEEWSEHGMQEPPY